MKEGDTVFRTVALSVVKHAYLPLAVVAHPRFQIVVVADDAAQPDWVHQRNQYFADQIGVPYVRDVARAIEQFEPTVAVVSSQAERHCGLGIQAADAGLHVILDKPMSPSLENCDRLVDTVKRNKVKSLVWNRNFLPALVQAREAIASGSIGELQAIHCDFYFAKDAGPPKRSRKPDSPPINWLERQLEAHADGSDGGVGETPMGELQIEGIYPLAYIHMLAGSPVVKTFARTATHFHQANVDNDADDLATVTLEMENGVVGSLSIGRIGAGSHPDIGEIKLHLLGSRGSLVITEARPEVGIYYRNQPPTEFKNRRIANDNDFLLMEDFARAIDEDGETILDVQAGRDICATVTAALESARTNS